MNKKNSEKSLSKRTQNLTIVGSIVALLVGVVLPIYLVSAGGPNGSFGLWSTPQEKVVLSCLIIIGVIMQVAALVVLRKWLKIIPLVALTPGVIMIFVAIFFS